MKENFIEKQVKMIVVEHIFKHFGEIKAVEDVSFEAEKGVVALLGQNGAGKTTLIRLITGYLAADCGKVLICGHDVEHKREKALENIGYVPENNPLYLEMYVKEYLQFVADIHQISKEKVDEIIDLVGITPEKSKKISQLSKGYKQRVGLAQAILHAPDLLILDEPTNGLDPNQILEIRNVIKEIGKEKTVILSTHIMQEVEALCTRVILIHQGNIIQDADIADFKGKFNNLEEAFAHYTSVKIED